jgi:hypothetical protein
MNIAQGQTVTRKLSQDDQESANLAAVNRATTIIEASEWPTTCSHGIPERNFYFLSLIPVSSSQYPPPRFSRGHHESSSDPVSAAEPWFIPIEKSSLTSESIAGMTSTKSRRSDSVSSFASFGRQRYLKLNPVHGGDTSAPDFTLVE